MPGSVKRLVMGTAWVISAGWVGMPLVVSSWVRLLVVGFVRLLDWIFCGGRRVRVLLKVSMT